MLQKVHWALARARSMSLAEIPHRVTEQLRRRMDRKRQPTVLSQKLETWPIAPALQERFKQAIVDPLTHQRALETWERTKTRRFQFLSLDWPETASLDECWFRDPTSEGFWDSESFCFAIDFRHERGLGDVKYVAELNRLQYLQPMSALAAVEKDEAVTRTCREVILSWISANKSFHGIHWSSMIELGLRATSISIAALNLGAAAFSDDEQKRIQQTMIDHAEWMLRYPSLHSSANNHYIAELAGLYLIGVLWPGLPRADVYRETGRTGLIQEVTKQFHDDGVGVEQSISYTALTLDWYVLCVALSEELDRPFPEEVRERLARAGTYLRAMLDENNHHPAIGDDDDSSVMRDGFGQEPVVASVLSAIAAMSGNATLSPPKAVPHLRNALFGAPQEAPTGYSGMKHFPSGGYTAIHDAMSGHNLFLLMDHGPLGYLSIAAHGHADALSLCLHLDGHSIFIDPNTGLYHGGGDKRNLFRRTSMHNTLSIAGEDSSVMTGPFNWGARANVTDVVKDSSMEQWHVGALHDGFMAKHAVYHHRDARKLDGQSFEIVDELQGDREATSAFEVSLSFMLAKDVACGEDTGSGSLRIMRDDQLLMDIAPDERLTTSVEAVAFSPAFGAIDETKRLLVTGHMTINTPYRTVIRIRD